MLNCIVPVTLTRRPNDDVTNLLMWWRTDGDWWASTEIWRGIPTRRRSIWRDWRPDDWRPHWPLSWRKVWLQWWRWRPLTPTKRPNSSVGENGGSGNSPLTLLEVRKTYLTDLLLMTHSLWKTVGCWLTHDCAGSGDAEAQAYLASGTDPTTWWPGVHSPRTIDWFIRWHWHCWCWWWCDDGDPLFVIVRRPQWPSNWPWYWRCSSVVT